MIESRDFNETGLSPRDEERFQKILWLVVSGSIVMILAAGAGITTWYQHARRLSEVDHSADAINSASLKKGYQEVGGAIKFSLQTTYENSRSGVKLKLPGVWYPVSAPGMTKPDVGHRFCVLSSADGLSAMFWPQSPNLLLSLDAGAALISKDFATSGTFVLKGERKLMMGGREAREVQLTSPKTGLDLNLVLLQKWPVVYVLAITGSSQSRDAWKQVENGLPGAVEIR